MEITCASIFPPSFPLSLVLGNVTDSYVDDDHTILWSRCIIRLCMKRAVSCKIQAPTGSEPRVAALISGRVHAGNARADADIFATRRPFDSEIHFR